MTHLEITDVTGTRWVGDPSDEVLTDADRAAIAEMFSNFKDLNYLSVEIGGAKHYFNPAHVIAATVKED